MDGKMLAQLKKTKTVALNKSKSLFDEQVVIEVKRQDSVIPMHVPLEINTEEKQEELEITVDNLYEELNENQIQEIQGNISVENIELNEELNEELEEEQQQIEEQEVYDNPLEKYIGEVRANKELEKRENKILEDALQSALQCKEQIAAQDVDAYQKLDALDIAIKKIDAYIKQTKSIFRGKIMQENETQEEERSLRESAKMLRIQLFLEKMSIYKQLEKERKEQEEKKNQVVEKVDEYQLYTKMLEADARKKLYMEYKEQSEQKKEQVEQIKDEQKADMRKRKNQQSVKEEERLGNTYEQKMREADAIAIELQEKIGANGFDVRHKQFERNRTYQNEVEEKIAQLRMVVLTELLEDNDQQLKSNNQKLAQLYEKEIPNKDELGELQELNQLFKTEWKDDQELDIAAAQYDKYFEKISNDDENGQLLPEQMRDLIAAQIVLFEKREQLKMEKNGFVPNEADTKETLQETNQLLSMQEVKEHIENEIRKEEREEQADQTQMQIEKEKEMKKVDDLENQKINNEYGMQGMATEEKEQEDKKRKQEDDRKRQLVKQEDNNE